jgi:hypothetical protein
MKIPDHLIYPLEPFAASFRERCEEGAARLASAKLAVVGLARNSAVHLAANLGRLEYLARYCGEWQLHIESNDCTDQTVQVLADFAKAHRQATFAYQELGRQQFSAEFAGPRTIALAEYRDACQRWVSDCAADSDYVVVIDWDQWGGWSHAGLLNGLGWMLELQGAYGMASVSMFQHDFGSGPQWAHYDLWALRGVGQPDTYWDTYTNGCGGWGYGWLPPVGSQPVAVASAFGGFAIYRTDAYLRGTYDGTTDCEHVPFHQSVARATGQRLYLCPSMRTVMHWMPDDARQHSDD